MNKRWQKKIRQLHQKKYRREYQVFLVEGIKSVNELRSSDFEIEALFYTDKYANRFSVDFPNLQGESTLTDEEVIRKTGTLQANDGVLAVVKQKQPDPLFPAENELVLALDEVRDPGNVGTILRVADWYGIKKVICSETTAEIYNPKVIAASMGSFTRVNCFVCDLPNYLLDLPAHVMRLGAMMNGESVYSFQPTLPAVLVMGNEANGVRPEISSSLDHHLTIPKYGGAESLNVGLATGILCDNLVRILTS